MPKRPLPGTGEGVIRYKLPVWNHAKGGPTTKMPVCPNCGEDRLVMTSSGYALCEDCRIWVEKSGDLEAEQ